MTTQNKNKQFKKTAWVGLVKLAGEPSNPILDGCRGAYSTFLTLSVSRRSFRNAAQKEAENLDLRLVSLVWCQTLESRLQDYNVDDYLLELANNLRSGSGYYGKFHVWEEGKQNDS